MSFAILKILAIAIVLFLLCLPFFPAKFSFSLSSVGYTKKDRWRNLWFVLEILVLGLVFLCIAPIIKNGLDAFFALRFMKWFTNLFHDDFLYTVDVVIILIANSAIYALFFSAKNALRKWLDATLYKDSASVQASKKKKLKTKKAQKTQTASLAKNTRDQSEKRLKQLRRDSVLVFGKSKKTADEEHVFANDYKITNKPNPDSGNRLQNDINEEEALSFAELIKRIWHKVIGLVYSKEDNYEYVNTGAYRWAKELKTFIFFVSVLYLIVFASMLLPIAFSFDRIPWFYTIAKWLVTNTFMFPMLSIVFLFELLWFIDGEHKMPEEEDMPFLTFVDCICNQDKVDLDKAREAILSKYAQSYNIKNFDSNGVGGQSSYDIGSKKLAIQNMAKAILSDKKLLNGDYMQSIEYMFEGKHVLFDSSLYSSLGEYIIHYLFVTLAFGTRVLFICKDEEEIQKASEYLEEGFKRITGTSRSLWRICTLQNLHEGKRTDILLLTPEQFLERSLYVDGKDFFEELVDVFVLDADKILASNNYYCLIMAKRLEKETTGRNADADLSVAVQKRIRYSFFSSGSIQGVGNSLRQFFNLENAPLEAFHSFALAAKNEVNIWHTGLSSTLYVDNGANQVALEVQIAKDASNLGVKSINLISDTAVYSTQVSEIKGLTLNHCDISDHPVGYVIVADDHFNLPNAIYNYSRFSGKKATVLHIISKPYLLRDYFTAKAENYTSHFELIGKIMCEHAEAKKTSMIVLLCDAVNGIEQSLFMRRAAELLGTDDEPSKNLKDSVKRCFEIAFGDCNNEPNYILRPKLDSGLKTKNFIYIRDSGSLFKKLLECTQTVKLEYQNTQKTEYLTVFKNEIAQHFIQGQVIARNNHTYTIKKVDIPRGELLLDDTGPTVNLPMDYIQTRLYSITSVDPIRRFGHDYRAKNSVVSHVEFTVYDAALTVDTVGYYSIEKAVQNIDLVKPNFAKYVNLKDNEQLMAEIQRKIKTKMLVVELDIDVENDPHLTYSLSVILHEFMKTVFPDHYRCISVCPLFDEGTDESFFGDETAIRDIYPRIITALPQNTEEKREHNRGQIRFAVIEDIEGGNGAVETLTDGNGIMVTNLLHVAADFLAWVLNGNDCKYLNFGYDKRPAVFDLELLESTIRQFRHDVEISELVRPHDESTCFFCHKVPDSDESTKLSDGRVICSSCAESTINSFDELDSIFKSVLDGIKNNTSVPESFPADITVDFVSSLELRKRYGNDAKKIPFAYCNHMTNCIYLEYGLPKSTVCQVIAGFITQLWQDHNIISDGSDIFDGHSAYVELQVLSLMRLKNEAELLEKIYETKTGLSDLRRALMDQGHADSFAYFLGVCGKNKGSIRFDDKNDNRDDDKNKNDSKDKDDDSDDDDILFIADRNPKDLPKYWYNRLNEDEKAVYDQLYGAILSHTETVNPLVKKLARERVAEIIKMIKDDNPDIFWCAYQIGVVTSDGTGVTFDYVMTASEVKKRKKQIENSIQPFLKGIKNSMSDYEAAVLAHENIVDLIDYDSIGLDIQDRDSQSHKKPDNLRSIYGVFVEKKAVCAGYAKAYQYLLNRMGIECTYVVGECHGGGLHAWNLIKLEGDYYYVDVTHDDRSNTDARKNTSGEISYDYFCITTQELLRSRNIRNAPEYPDCTAVKCNYFVRNKMVFKDYDATRISQLILSAFDSGKKEIALKMANKAVYDVVHKRLITDGGVFDIIQSSNASGNFTGYYHYTNEDLNILHIILS